MSDTSAERVLLVTGSRNWRDNMVIVNYMMDLANQGWMGTRNILLNGYARGADQSTRTQAILLGWNPQDYLPKDYQEPWMSYGRACNVRNQRMVDVLRVYRDAGCETRSVAFWRTHSTGTGNTLDMLNAAGFEPKIFYDCPCHG